MLEALDHAVAGRTAAGPVAMARVMVGLGALLQLGLDGPQLLQWLNPDSLRLPYLPGIPAATVETLPLIVALWLGAGVCFSLGWHTRAVGTLLASVIFWRLGFDEQFYSNHHYLLVLVIVLLTLADCGAAFSIDSRHRPRTTVPVWPVFLLQAQAVIMYAFATLAKCNPEYLRGRVFRADVVAINWLEDALGEPGTTVVSVIGAWTALTMEAALTILLARALVNPRWRRPAAVLGITLHAGIATMMSNSLVGSASLTVFALASWAMYLPFVPLSRNSGTWPSTERWQATHR